MSPSEDACETADVLIVGAGPGGCVVAGALARRGFDVVLLGRAPRVRRAPELLAPDTLRDPTNDSIDIEAVAGAARRCLGVVHDWHGGGPDFTEFGLLHCAEGLIVERTSFDALLRDAAQRAGARYVDVADLNEVELNEAADRVVASWGAGRRTAARLIVEATGSGAGPGHGASAQRIVCDRLTAIQIPLRECRLSADCLHLGTLRCGWWYVLTPPVGSARLVVMTDGDLLPPVRRQLASWLNEQIAERPRLKAEVVLPNGENFADAVAVRDARTTCRRRLRQGRRLPIGDAAFTLDPLSGTGVGRAVRSASAAVDPIATFLATDDAAALDRFALDGLAAFSQRLSERAALYTSARLDDAQRREPFWRRRCGANRID